MATWVCALLALGVSIMPQGASGAAPETEADVSFARDVLPILSDKCFVCHGPDAGIESDLRLDSLEHATVDRGGYRALDPEQPQESAILARIHSEDDPMPPADAEKPLTESERKILTKWVESGGAYEQHWAFVTPVKVTPPDQLSDTETNPIDGFIASKLRKQGIEFAPEADRTTLARRSALVLTGLPPEPQRLKAFLEDERDDAYDRWIDELLSDPKYGEHQARYWLDAIRYGDTHGLHLDNRRGIYPYRDWVVHALNRNLPLDQFITWQLAGDLLPDPSLEQLVATGFVRMNPTTSEGGAIPAEFQAKNNFDRTETLGTVLLGMTLNCARCHTHKYDPIPQAEYYRLLAFFNSTAEPSMDGNAYEYAPVIHAPADQAAWSQWEALEKQRRQLQRRADEWAASREGESSSALRSYSKAAVQNRFSGWWVSRRQGADEEVESLEDGEAVDWRIEDETSGVQTLTLPPISPSFEIAGTLEGSVSRSVVLEVTAGWKVAVSLDGKPIGEPERLFGDQRERSIRISLPAGKHEIRLSLEAEKAEPAAQLKMVPLWGTLLARGSWDACSPEERLALVADRSGPCDQPDLQSHVVHWFERRQAARDKFTTTLVAKELPSPRETRVLRRGEYDAPIGDTLEPGVLSAMGEFPGNAPRNRLGLARWLTSREHPLVSRVLVNRIWQRTFGHALVRTPEDFGLQGQQPTHPALLDWLAVELQDSGWDLKHMLRLMVTSRTFRQHSATRGDIDDPENRLFARGPRFRLDAEVIRDLGLWASGLLDPFMGGEGVKPYQPDGMWLAMAHPASNTKKYVRDEGRRLYRRSLYVYWKRTSPHPMMTLFDAPDRESSCVRRSRTSTPLQSLGLLNETQRIEMSRKLAERLLREADTDEERINRLFTLIACRAPFETERQACMRLLREMKQRYEQNPADATRLLATGDAERDETLSPQDVAAWSQVATTVLASDLALMLY